MFVSDGKQYEEFDWRDPFVYWNEEDECYDMLLASRIKGGGELRGGCIALCKSKDLKQWTYEKPFYAPGMYITMECPEIFKMGNYWYLVFSTFSDQFTTHYRISKSPNGPWEIPEDDVFDTRSDYAIKTASDGQRRFAFGWIASKYGNKDFGPWEWGGTMVFHELIQNPEDGTLKVRVIPGVKEFYDEVQDLKPAAGYNSRITKTEKGIHVISDTLGSGVYEIPEDCFSIEMDVCVKRGHEFGIALHVDSEMEKGYFLRMNQRKKEVAWDMWPRSEKGIYQWQIKGDIPYQIETSRRLPDADEYHLLINYLPDHHALNNMDIQEKELYMSVLSFFRFHVWQNSRNLQNNLPFRFHRLLDIVHLHQYKTLLLLHPTNIFALTFETPEAQTLFTEVMKLPEKYRIVIHLFYYEDYTIREIAKIMNVTESNVKVRLTRGRRLLRNVLKEEWENDR